MALLYILKAVDSRHDTMVWGIGTGALTHHGGASALHWYCGVRKKTVVCSSGIVIHFKGIARCITHKWNRISALQ